MDDLGLPQAIKKPYSIGDISRVHLAPNQHMHFLRYLVFMRVQRVLDMTVKMWSLDTAGPNKREERRAVSREHIDVLVITESDGYAGMDRKSSTPTR